jgi:molybdopterin synthase sulfur carrier subunit
VGEVGNHINMIRQSDKKMKIKFKFFGPFREVVKTKELEITTKANSKILDVLDFLVEEYGEKMREILFDSKTTSLRNGIQVLINGSNINLLNGINTLLKKGDLVTLYPQVVGGAI